MEHMISDRRDGCITLRLRRGTTNALTTEVITSLAAALRAAEQDSTGVMLCGGEKFFSNGVDLEWALGQSRAQIRELFVELGLCILRLLEMPIPVVGVIRGHAIGAALAMQLACDYRYAARGRVLVGKPEILLGVPNPYYGDQLLRFVAGDFIASDLIYSGALIAAESTRALNFIHAVDDTDAIEARAWAQLLALRDLAPAAFAESKHMRSGELCGRIRQHMSARVARQVELWHSSEAQLRLTAAAQRTTR